jgi:hypothetical protein
VCVCVCVCVFVFDLYIITLNSIAFIPGMFYYFILAYLSKFVLRLCNNINHPHLHLLVEFQCLLNNDKTVTREKILFIRDLLP